MFEEMRIFLSSSEAIGVAVLGMVVAIFKAAKILTNAVDMHENYFVGKRHKRLKESRSGITTEGLYTRYFDQAIQLEAVRIEFGVRSSEFGVRSSEFGVRSSEFARVR
jgi:hypothetical protein